MSDAPPLSAMARRKPAPIVIDGVATLLARRPLPLDACPAPAHEGMRAAPEAKAPRPFGRRAAHRRPLERDLVFPGAAPRPFARPSGEPAGAAGGLGVFGRKGGSRPARRGLAGAAAALAFLALPAGLLAGPVGTAIATPAARPLAPLVIDGLVTSIQPRGTGAVLSVEGLIRNVSGGPALVPPLRIALAESGGERRTKALSTGAGPLAAGRVLRFHSTVAVAKGTRGEIAVDFIAPPPAPGKTLIE